MAQRMVTFCDLCQSQIERRYPFFIQTGWQSDVAGGPSERDGRQFDLCDNCLRRAFAIAIECLKDFEVAKSFLDKLLKCRKV